MQPMQTYVVLPQASDTHAPLQLLPAGGPVTRAAAIAFGAGFGGGSAWQACAADVSDAVFQQPHACCNCKPVVLADWSGCVVC